MSVPGAYVVWFWAQVQRLGTRPAIAERILMGNIRALMAAGVPGRRADRSTRYFSGMDDADHGGSVPEDS